MFIRLDGDREPKNVFVCPEEQHRHGEEASNSHTVQLSVNIFANYSTSNLFLRNMYLGFFASY
jgi:hypothetical protein